ncbi:MAG: hypothetical protein H7259_08750, partial [Cytophagales bacterium]|nr:hypothetical protein [Cytophaga sp.]
IHAYADVFAFPWLNYRVHIPSHGEEYFVRIEYRPNKKTMVYFQYRFEQKYWDVTNTSLTLPATRQSNILYFEHKISVAVSLRTRIQWESYDNGMYASTGSLCAQDIIYKKMKYQITLRAMWYDVDDYNARQYAYEPDVPYSFYIPAYNGKAFRPMLIVRYKLMKQVDLWSKVALTKPLNSMTAAIIDSNLSSMIDWNWQLRWIF